MINFIKAPKFGDELENLSINKEGQKYFAEFHGGIRAGFPSPAEDFLSDRVSLDERYLSKIGSTFVNRVRGLSMYPEYLDGDDIVVSINASDYTLKRYDKKNSTLMALNPKYSESVKIEENDEVVILGVVDTIIREKKKRY